MTALHARHHFQLRWQPSPFRRPLIDRMGNCNSSTVNSESVEIAADGQRHPSLLAMAVRTNMKFGWKPDMPDHRDHHVTFDSVSAPSHIQKKAEGSLGF